MAHLQQNRPDWIASVIRNLGVRYRPEDIGLSEQAVVRSLVTARHYAQSDGLPYSILNMRTLDEQQAAEVVRKIVLLV